MKRVLLNVLKIKIKMKKQHVVLVAVLMSALIIWVIARAYRTQEYVVSGHIMGTTYRVKYVTYSLSFARQKQVAEAVAHVLHSVDQSMSTYKPNSELMRLNAWPVGKAFTASAALTHVLGYRFGVVSILRGRL